MNRRYHDTEHFPPRTIRNGVLVRERRLNSHYFHFVQLLPFRLGFVLVLLVLLIVTNPGGGNPAYPLLRPYQKRISRWLETKLPLEYPWRRFLLTRKALASLSSARSTSSSWLFPDSTTSDYLLFTLKRYPLKLEIIGLMHQVPLCSLEFNHNYHHPDKFGMEYLYPTICEFIAHTACHGKPFLDFKNHLAFSTCQLCSMLWVISVLLSFCVNHHPSSSPMILLALPRFPEWIQQSILSVFHYKNNNNRSQNLTLLDILRWNFFAYPALQAMENMIRSYNPFRPSDTETQFGIGCLSLLVLVGGLANYISTILVSSSRFPVTGIDSMVGACLGYIHAWDKSQQRSSWFISFVNIPLSTAFHIWSHMGCLFLQGRIGTLVAFFLSLMMGERFWNVQNQFLFDSFKQLVRSSFSSWFYWW